jgi:hypothetical protein
MENQRVYTQKQKIEHRIIDWAVPVSVFFLADWITLLWFYAHWDFFPDWTPVPGAVFMNLVEFFAPLLLCWYAILSIFILSYTIVFIGLTIKSQKKLSMPSLVSLVGMSMALFLWIFGSNIEQGFINYAITRYDRDINAIEKYYADHGKYPPTLEALEPVYLKKMPGIYMKYGEELKYDPNSEKGYVGHGPFTFELYGHYKAWHGQTLKYCPIDDPTCEGFKRIDRHWVWAYSHAL